MTTYADRRMRYTKLPSPEEINNIPLVHVAEFELSDKETRQLRAHLYAVNKDGIRRYRTLREFNLVLVWRIK
jgi:hypothetical protein